MTGRRRGHGEGSVYRRSDGRWVAVLDLGWRGGKRSRKYFYGKTREQVARKLARGLAQHQGRVAQVGVTTSAVGAAYATWSSFPVVGLGLVVSSAMEASLR